MKKVELGVRLVAFFLSYGHDIGLLCRELTNGILLLSLFPLLRT